VFRKYCSRCLLKYSYTHVNSPSFIYICNNSCNIQEWTSLRDPAQHLLLGFYQNFIGTPRSPTSGQKAAGVSVSVHSRTVQFEKQWTFNHLRILLLLIKSTYFSKETLKNLADCAVRLCGQALLLGTIVMKITRQTTWLYEVSSGSWSYSIWLLLSKQSVMPFTMYTSLKPISWWLRYFQITLNYHE